ncbi:TIGR03668 family PPOX class F420-dependent oxidoreductase [Nocardioides sp. CER19]|uniref:TIGR03668 family PPOX class F420-dependent oxidoreductase n=1 Tax=Nocardioides sp. CER19 TaxID=3038538 RepID=UPI0024487FA1|nr:TIGR03668 family PPOX class F420-dependent oxidoreductase [Nocardioides sp. CER19]MDH2413647.1 TIGR03668 family PPOX class F420-dependent oxidoreductase [Nocardioides sp. CER19]
MRRGPEWARERFATARVARLATVAPDGSPYVVPVVFAVDGDALLTAVDHKPKSTTRLRRLANIAANPRVSLLVDVYDDDWSQLWWARADGTAQVHESYDLAPLVARYDAYRATPPTGPVIVVSVERWSGWSF